MVYGKTTLIKLITNIISSKQNILIENRHVNEYSKKDLAKKIAYIPQDINIGYNFSAFDIVLMGRLPFLGLLEDYNQEDCEKAKIAMLDLNVYDLKDRNFNTLSGGEKQRVVIARALVQDTNILVLDEPISELDIGNQISTMNILQKLNQDKNITIICVLHDINIALNFTEKILLLNNGKVVKYDSTYKVLNEKILKDVFGVDTKLIEKDGKFFISFL